MIGRKFVALAGAFAVALLSGCATQFQVVQDEVNRHGDCLQRTGYIANTDGQDTEIKVARKNEAGRVQLNPAYVAAVLRADATLNPFLDCFFGVELPSPSDPKVVLSNDPRIQQAQIYRGYIALSLFATYGAFNFELGDYESRTNDASGMLRRIEEAHILLVSSSTAFDEKYDVSPFKASRPSNKIPHVERLRRILQVFEVSKQAARPTIERSKAAALSLAGASLNPATVKKAGEFALTGLYKTLNLRHYGRAYMADMRDELKAKKKAGWKLDDKDWMGINRIIVEACDRLLPIAEIKAGGHNCKLSLKTKEQAEAEKKAMAAVKAAKKGNAAPGK